MSPATAADEFKLAFYQAVQALMAAGTDTPYVDVSYGLPSTFEPEDLVSVGAVRSTQTFATISTNRSREETLELDVAISCFRGGGAEMEIVAAQRAYQLLRMIETQFRQTDTTVGGTVRYCFLISHDSSGATDPALIEQGRVIEITAKFQAVARIT